MRRIGRAWGNALGGWRRQGRDGKGRFLPKAGGTFRTAHRAGQYSRARRTLKTGGRRGVGEGAISALSYGVTAANSLRQKGFFINPEIGLSGGGVSVGYGKKIAPNWRGSIAIKVSVTRTNDPVQKVMDKAFDKAEGTFGKRVSRDSELYNLARYGVASTPVDGTVLVRSGTTLRLKSGGKAARAQRAIPKKRAAQDKAKKEQAQYRAQRRNAARESKKPKDIGNGHKVVQKNAWDNYKSSHNKAEVTLEHRRVRAKQAKRKKSTRSNKKGVARTITA